MGENERTVWDDAKNDVNIGRRGIDFSGLDRVFDRRVSLVRQDDRRDYGEQRFNMLVACNDFVLNVTFTPRGSKQRIISARLATRRERRLFDDHRQDG